jgi:NADPH-dependent curcumin reductase
LESKAAGYATGDLVTSFSGWQSHAVMPAAAAKKVDVKGLSPSLALGVLGMPGLTAYAGLLRLGQPKPGDVLLVSSAAGAVGSSVGQIARIKGCHVIGIAGGPGKCAWVVNEARFNACLDYKSGDLRAALKEAAPKGVDVYFDNVGGEILQVAMEQLAIGARVVLCGLMAQYNSDTVPSGPNPALTIKARATVRGMVVYDHEDARAEMVEAIAGWIKSGAFAVKEDLVDGLASAPAAFERLMQGGTFGKPIVKVA